MKSRKPQLFLVGSILLLLARPPSARAGGSVSESPAPGVGAAAVVFDYYFKIQMALARDSMTNLAVNADAIAQIVRTDTTAGFPAQLAGRAEALAGADNLAAARQLFKGLSGYLIEYLRTGHIAAGTYHQAHCPMVNADWLQADAIVRNPYLGKSMPHCGALTS